jgi:hypothetical protein
MIRENKTEADKAPAVINVVENWFDELKERVLPR